MAQTRVLLGHVRGEKGDQGDPGTPGADSTVPGPPGEAATLSVGTTTTSAAGGQASVTQAGTPQARVFNFTIPQGAAGPPGVSGASSLQFPPFFPMTTFNVGGGVVENRATIPDWTLSDTNKLLFLNGFFQFSGPADRRILLNINLLGARPVMFPAMSRFGMRTVDAVDALWMTQDGWTLWMPWMTAQPHIMRFNGSNFQPMMRDQIYDDIARAALGGGSYRQSHGRLLTVDQDTVVPNTPRLDVVVWMPQTTGTSRVVFKLPLPRYGPLASQLGAWARPTEHWSYLNDRMMHLKRRLIFRRWPWGALPPAGTVRIANYSRSAPWDDESLPGVSGTRIYGYQVRVAQHLIDTGVVTAGTGYIDIPWPGGAGETEVEYQFSFQHGDSSNYGGGLTAGSLNGWKSWEPRTNFTMWCDILSVKTMVNV